MKCTNVGHLRIDGNCNLRRHIFNFSVFTLNKFVIVILKLLQDFVKSFVCLSPLHITRNNYYPCISLYNI